MAVIVATIALGARLFIAGVLLQAAVHKLNNRLEFQGIIQQYRLLPKGPEASAVFLLAGLETVAAVTLLFLPPTGALLAATLLTSYAIAMGINIARGRYHIDCGCGGESTPLSPALVIRNLLMTVLLVCVPVTQSDPSGVESSIILGLGFALGLGALYLCYNQLQTNAGIYRRLWLGERVG